MKILDATFLIDYLDGVESTREYLLEHDREVYVLPVPAYTEALLGEGNGPEGNIEGAREDLSWGEVYAVDEQTAVTAAEIADEMGQQGPFLSGMDALIAAIGRELDASVVSADRHLTHEETKKVVDVEEY
jgi:predicted nucleic acid-binding protein